MTTPAPRKGTPEHPPMTQYTLNKDAVYAPDGTTVGVANDAWSANRIAAELNRLSLRAKAAEEALREIQIRAHENQLGALHSIEETAKAALHQLAGEGEAPSPRGAEAGACWLIERSQPEGQTPTCWWDDLNERWVEDAARATQYATQAKAEVALDRRSGIKGVHSPFGHVTEHVFLDILHTPKASGGAQP